MIKDTLHNINILNIPNIFKFDCHKNNTTLNHYSIS